MRPLREALDDCGLTTIGFKGYKFTCSNRWHGDGNDKLKLDRMVANGDFLFYFIIFMTCPKATTYHLNSIMSDHLPLLMYVRPDYWEKRKMRFLFEEMWTTVEGCQDTITHALESKLHGTVVKKLKACQGSLWIWKQSFGASRGN